MCFLRSQNRELKISFYRTEALVAMLTSAAGRMIFWISNGKRPSRRRSRTAPSSRIPVAMPTYRDKSVSREAVAFFVNLSNTQLESRNRGRNDQFDACRNEGV
jgi:hypothetical protein